MDRNVPSPSATCFHCHAALLDVETVLTDGSRAFCCAGCVSARKVIEGLGLGRFDALGGAPGPVQSVVVGDNEAAALDEVVATARALKTTGPCRLEVDVDGVSCASCAWLVEKVAGQVEGVSGCTLNPARGTLELTIAPAFAPAKLATALATVGHRVRPAGSGDSDGRARGDDLVFRLGVTSALAMASMIASFSLFLGLTIEDQFGRVFTFIAGASSFLAVAIGGWPFLRGAWASLRQGAPTMDLPIATGMIAASIANVLAARAGAVVSFDTVAIFVTLMLAGRLVERRLVWRHRELLTRKDADIAGLKVRRLDERGAISWRTVKDIAVGDRLHLARGELVPVDGVVDAAVEQTRALSFAWLTGESEAVQVPAGAPVAAGAHVVDARGCVVQATRPFSSTRLSALLAERPRESKNDDEERTVASGLFPWLARVWVVFAFGIAGVGALLWRHAPAQELLGIVAALLVVTCPCAFGIAAPLAVERATVLLRERGVFVRNARLWWRAFAVQHAVFDKTGTLTEDEPVVDVESRARLLDLPPEARAALAAVVSRSNHGRSRALARLLGDGAGLVADVEEMPGVGLTGRVGDLVITVGRDTVDDGLTRIVIAGHAGGHAIDTVVVVGFAEALRQGAAAALRRLQEAGVDVWVASGDGAERAVALAARVGVPAERVLAPCQPEDKAALVRRLGSTRVLVVGDGVNDAAMFEAAAVSGVPATDRPHLPARADFILLGSSRGGAFGSVVDVVVVARRLRAALITLLSVATVYNIAVVTAGLMGLLTPLLVALLMPAMSVSLLLLALALVRLPPSSPSSSTSSMSPPSLSAPRPQEAIA